MKKRAYKATKVKALNLHNLNNQVKDKDIVFAIDVAKEKFMGSIMTSDKQVIITIKWDHPTETSLLLDILVNELSWHSLDVAMEPSGTYGDSIRFQFQERGIAVYRVSPKRTHDASEVYDGVPSSHDAKSCAIIGRLHLEGFSEEWREQDESQRDLVAALTMMEIFDDAYGRNINRLEALVARYWPELTQYLKLRSASLLELLAAFGCPAAVAASPEEAGELMRKTGGSSLKEDKINGVIASADSTLGVTCLEAEQKLMRELAQEVRRLQKNSNQARNRIELMTQEIEAVQQMTPMMGKVTSAVLYIVLGNMKMYDNAGSVVKALGLNLKEHSSGAHKGQLHITKRGSGSARFYIYMAVLRLIKGNKIIKAWHHAKVKRDGGIKMKSIAAIMRKIAAALWHVGQGSKFDASKLFDTSRLAIS
jgi:transposase